MTPSNTFPTPSFSKKTIVIVGGYGSGKSEVSVNLARLLAGDGKSQVAIADLDIVNPYFRSREVAEELAILGVKSLIPHGDQKYADLPVIIPEIKAAIEASVGWLVLDVGGDDAGATVLKSLGDAFVPDCYEMLLTHNCRRPFTADVDGTVKVMREIETACGLKFTGIIANSHLLEQTTPEIVTEGLDMAREVSERTDLPLCFLSVRADVLTRIDSAKIDCPVLPLERSLLKPWERKSSSGTGQE
ncbi:MAG: cobalamin biosynthesis protein CbiA [Candidatus Zixiibacteriota bacterium]|nr:MAG: cobalamin biosynthesis protein CbiA [candidate division Zixibacteria bacterium]